MKTKFSKLSGFLAALALIGVFTLQSCKDDEVSPTPTDVENPLTQEVYYITGLVQEGGAALSGVSVSSGSVSATTAADGSYELDMSSPDQATVSFSKDGYVSIDAVAIFSSDAAAGATVIVSQEMTALAPAQTASATEANVLEFNHDDEDEDTTYASLSIPAGALTEDTDISATLFTPAADVVTASSLSSSLEDEDDEATVTVSSTFAAIDLQPDGLEFEDEVTVTVSVPISSSDYFTSVQHVKSENGSWVVQGAASFNSSDKAYEITVDGFSQHGVSTDCTVSATKSTNEVLLYTEIDNLGYTDALEQTISYDQYSGWVETSSSSSSSLYSEMKSYVSNTMGTSEGVSTIEASKDVAVSGDELMSISVEQEVIVYTFTFTTNTGSQTISVKSYGAVSVTVETVQGDMRVDHNI